MTDCPHYVNIYGTCEICHAYKPTKPEPVGIFDMERMEKEWTVGQILEYVFGIPDASKDEMFNYKRTDFTE